MTPEQKAVFIMAKIFEAYATLEIMKAANVQDCNGCAYTDKEMREAVDKFEIDHNSIRSFFEEN